MQQRLTGIYLALLVVATLGLAVPLALAVVERESQEMVFDRTSDAARFSSLASNAVLTGQTEGLTSELEVYGQIFDIDVLVLDSQAEPVAGSSPDLTLAGLQGSAGETAGGPDERVLAALAGVRHESEDIVWPWAADRMLVAEPVNDSGETIGAVVMASPTDALTRSMRIQWAVIAAGLLLILGLGALVANPISRWVLRPVAELGRAADAVRQGELGVQVSTDEGPGELKQLGEAFNQMSATIEEILHRQRSFVAYAGHQIRNPLAVVRLRVESLGVDLPAEQLPAHWMALEELDRLNRTCEGLLNLAVSADVEQHRVYIDIAEVAGQRRDAWLPIAEQLEAEIELDIPEGLGAALLEHTLDQVLDVLIDNALKFGGQGVTVRLTAYSSGDSATEVVVADDGPGLPRQMLEEAVVPFWRREIHPDRSVAPQPPPGSDPGTESPDYEAAKGMGLGLSAVVSLLELDQGTLTLHQRHPHGIRAVIRLETPAVRDDEQV